MVIASIISVILIIIGANLIIKYPLRTSSTNGKISSISESFYTVNFTVNGVQYSANIPGRNAQYRIGDSVAVHYEPKNPQIARVGMSNRSKGFILISIALLILLIAGLITYFTMKSKTFAAIEGGDEVANQLFNLV
jgi:hypothetical protein